MSQDAPPPVRAAREWSSPWRPTVDAERSAQGWERVRLVHQMRRSLPLPPEVRDRTRPIVVRGYEPEDRDGLLRVNNRAFAWHPDQGGWDAGRLEERMAEPWFRQDDLLVHHTDGRVDGFCWTKVHEPAPAGTADGPRPAAGEIFVIAADPDSHGTGLGRALTVAGLDHLAAMGLGLALLYVEAGNDAAIALYERLGFRVHHSDAGYAPRQT